MELEVVGRHALLFDDDAMAAFVNSEEALVEWNTLHIDRYDVRHLLSCPPPPRPKRRPLHQDEADLDHERYLDLPSDEPEDDQDNDAGHQNSGGYHAIGFSYGSPEESMEKKSNINEPSFHPNFPLPESMSQNLMLGAGMELSGIKVAMEGTSIPFDVISKERAEPLNEKIHQIIAKTATFVSKHGSQSEIVLRVKQGDNPTFGFLMPSHVLHPYFRYLVDHQELLNPETNLKSSAREKKCEECDQTGGALSLLGSVYGSGEDEDGMAEEMSERKRNGSDEFVSAVTSGNTDASHGKEQTEPSVHTKHDGPNLKSTQSSVKDKIQVIKRNQTISSVKTGNASKIKKGDVSDSSAFITDKLGASTSSAAKMELPTLEPPSDMKRVIDKMVEFISRNGREFEAALIEQDRNNGRFPFLLPSDPYHPYYMRILQDALEPNLSRKSFSTDKHNTVTRGADKKHALSKESGSVLLGSASSDIPYDYDRKEKFKMFIGKFKKDGQDGTSKDPGLEVGVDVDAAAAILQAATRGIKNPNLELLSKTTFSGNSQGHASDGRGVSSLGSLHSSLPPCSSGPTNEKGDRSISVPVAKAIAQTAAIAAASEADSSEASLTREQKLKAERLKRAKTFAVMIKNGIKPLKNEQLQVSSLERARSGASALGVEGLNVLEKEREGSCVPFGGGGGDSDENPKSGLDDRRSKRKYHSRSKKHTKDDKESEEDREDRREHRHTRKKHRSHQSLHHSRDKNRHKHKRRRHSSSKDMDLSEVSERSDSEYRHSRRDEKCKSSSSDKLRTHPIHRHRDRSSSDDEHRHCSSSDDEDHRKIKSAKGKRRPHFEKEADLDEGEIIVKSSDQSKASEGEGRSREASVELSKSHVNGREPSQPSGTTEVSDEFRAKIRAMLMATM